MNKILELARPDIRALQPYQHAAWEPALDRLHANEMPWAASEDESKAGLNRYPEPQPAELIEHLLDIGGISPELVTRTDLVAPALAAIRADLEAMETYQRPLTTTAVPILALGSHDDPVVVAERLHLWSLETTGTFSRVMFRGGHFFIYQPQQIASAVDLLLSRVPV